ncbi:MAG: mandelate racemase/muconate lactonizing enzyme family protein [Armatimonadota bacterium]|nr:mandelate racemase/muconate lactonizing enzyme family protein [Armatimonadota bacterium]
MKITRVRSRQVDVALPTPFHPAWAPGRVETQLRFVYVKIDTDAGISGIAGHEFYGADEQAVAAIAPHLVGEDPLRLQKHAATLRYLWPYFGAAVWFVEVALWDIKGKVAGLPVYKLLGGTHDVLPAYASTGQNRTPAERADDVRRLRDEGFRAVKLRVRNETLAADVAQVAAVRQAVGDDMAIMVDANQADTADAPFSGPHWTYHRALETARVLADYGVTWLEEPLPRHAYAELQRLHAASPVPIAGGENNQGLVELHRLLTDGCYDILQPDVTLCEGLMHLHAFGITANAAGVLVTPHTWGDPLGTVANLHYAASLHKTTFFEFPHDPPAFPASAYQQTLKEPLAVRDGMVFLPQGPGLGVELQDWIFG